MGIIPQQRTDNFVGAVFRGREHCLGSTAGKIVAVCAAVGCLGSLAGWTLLVGQTAQAAAKDGLFANIFAAGQPARRTGGRVGHRGGDHDAAGFGNDVSDRLRTVWQNCLDCRYYDVVAVYLFLCGDQNSRPRENVGQSGIVLYDCRSDRRPVQYGGNDRFGQRTNALGADFVISTIIFYELSVNRKLEIKDTGIKPGGCCVPVWVRYMTPGDYDCGIDCHVLGFVGRIQLEATQRLYQHFYGFQPRLAKLTRRIENERP